MLVTERRGPARPRSLMNAYAARMGALVGQRRARLALRAGKTEAEAASKAKSDFLANMSHELRTPLNAILGFAQLIIDDDGGMGEPARKEYASDIAAAGRHLLGIVNDILDLAKLQAGAMSVFAEDVDVVSEVKASVAMVRGHAERKGVELRLVAPPAEFEIRSEARRVRQILINILSNAVKYTPGSGQVAIAVTPVSTSAIAVQIRDTGVGMTPDELERAQTPFGQVDNAMTRQENGTGIGLPLTKSLADLLGARFQIESRPGVGTTVTLAFRDLPDARASSRD